MSEGILVSILVGLVVIVVSMVLHELMHAVTGYLLGDDTAKQQGRITLNPLAHIHPIYTVALPLFLLSLGGPAVGAARPVPFNPSRLKWGEYGMALVALAGPLTNLALAFIGSALFSLISVNQFWADAMQLFISINVVFFVINMLPIPPLDGSRVLYVFMPDSVRDFMRFMEPFGLFVVFAIFIFGQQWLSPFLLEAIDLVIGVLP